MHLNPVRAKWIGLEDRMLACPWSSLGWYLAAPAHRPTWVRVDRLLGEHGIAGDMPAGRREFERRMEARRASEGDGESCEPLRAAWCVGGEDFGKELLERMEGRLGEHHAGELRRESAEARGERILGEELARLGWQEADLRGRQKSDPEKLRIALRLRREIPLTIGWIAERLWLGTRKSATTRLQEYKAGRPTGTG